MKTSLLSTVAILALTGSTFAADLPSTKSALAPIPAPMWTGFYAGLNAGGTWANNSALNSQTWNLYQPADAASYLSASLLSGSVNSSGNAGFIGGGQVGYNYQINNLSGQPFGLGLIVGLEADIQGIAGSGNTQARTTAGRAADNAGSWSSIAYQTGSSNLQYLGTLRGRLGVSATPTLFIYGTGGLAYGGVSASIQSFGNNSSLVSAFYFNNTGSGSYSNTLVGWTAGGGIEWMFLQNWSAKAEYLYYDLGQANASVYNLYTTSSGGSGIQSVTNLTGRFSGNIVRAGVNYHFNFANAVPVVAKF